MERYHKEIVKRIVILAITLLFVVFVGIRIVKTSKPSDILTYPDINNMVIWELNTVTNERKQVGWIEVDFIETNQPVYIYHFFDEKKYQW